jgi:hypothetical protein
MGVELWNGGMTEWRNCGQMAEWSNGGNARLADGMAEWLPKGGMVEWWEWLPTYYFMVHANNNDDDGTF